MNAADVTVRCRWATHEGDIAEAVSFFVHHVNLAYISHGEVYSGRAIDLHTWSPALKEVLRDEFMTALDRPGEQAPYARVALAHVADHLAGIALLEVRPGQSMAILHDLVVDRHQRDRAIGSTLLQWLEAHLAALHIPRLFLESGITNTGAHRFFARHGYAVCSQVMMKEINL